MVSRAIVPHFTRRNMAKQIGPLGGDSHEHLIFPRPEIAAFRALLYPDSFQGFAALTPGYFLAAPPGLVQDCCFATVSHARGAHPSA